MIPVLNDLKEYLEIAESGYKVKANCPADKLEELKKMNDEYTQNMGEPLFVFDTEKG